MPKTITGEKRRRLESLLDRIGSRRSGRQSAPADAQTSGAEAPPPPPGGEDGTESIQIGDVTIEEGDYEEIELESSAFVAEPGSSSSSLEATGAAPEPRRISRARAASMLGESVAGRFEAINWYREESFGRTSRDTVGTVFARVDWHRGDAAAAAPSEPAAAVDESPEEETSDESVDAFFSSANW
jgi:hypothetical protein